jgi:hypothetical protein
MSPKRKEEHFEVIGFNGDIDDQNKGPEPWMRHSVQSSLPMNIEVKYPTTYFYEYDNATYDIALKKTFGFPCKKGRDLLDVNQWKLVDLSGEILNIDEPYNAMLQDTKKKLNDSEYLWLPHDNPNMRPDIQIVHDRLIDLRLNTSTRFKYAFTTEYILYRESKYHGKHVRVTTIVEYDESTKKWGVYVVEIELLGIVSEDQIGFFPVAFTDVGRTSLAEKLDASPSVLLTEKDIDQVVAKQSSLQQKNIMTNIALNS